MTVKYSQIYTSKVQNLTKAAKNQFLRWNTPTLHTTENIYKTESVTRLKSEKVANL